MCIPLLLIATSILCGLIELSIDSFFGNYSYEKLIKQYF